MIQELAQKTDAELAALYRSGLAAQQADWWQQQFTGNFYLELQRTGRGEDEQHLHAAVALAADSPATKAALLMVGLRSAWPTPRAV